MASFLQAYGGGGASTTGSFSKRVERDLCESPMAVLCASVMKDPSVVVMVVEVGDVVGEAA
jgi:hypothetical protein